MRKIYLFLLACAFLFGTTAMAQGLSDSDAQKLMSVSDQATEITEGSWYIMEQSRGGVSYLYANESDSENRIYRKANDQTAVTLNGKYAGENKAALVRFAKVTGSDTYNIIFGTGAYFGTPINNANIKFTTDASAAGALYINKVTKTDGSVTFQFGTTEAGGTQVDNNYANNPLGGWNEAFKKNVDATVGNNEWRIYEVTLLDAVDFTYVYTVDGTEKLRETVTGGIGDAFPAPQSLPAYVNYTLPTGIVSVGDAETEKTVECVYDLPFVASEGYDNAKWYIVDMHSNDTGASDINSGEKRYVWTYDASKTYNVSLPKAESKQASLFGDEKLWCFVGNPFDGFEIYNKAAGASMKLYRQGDGSGVTSDKVAQMSSENTTKFILVPSSQITGATSFKPVGHTYYLNTQANNNVDGGLKYLTGWTATDGGSSCRFFAPTDFVKDMADMWPSSFVGCVGSPVALTAATAETLTNLSAGLAADGWNTSLVTEEITTLLTSLKTNFILPEAGKYYRILSAVPGFNRNKAIDRNASNELRWDTKNPDRIEQIWTLSPVEGGYAMQSLKDDMYPGTAAPVTLSFDATVLELINLGSTQFKLTTNGSSNPFHAGGHGNGAGSNGNIIQHNAGAGSASAWYIEEVTDKTKQELARMQLRAFYEDNVASMPELSADAEQIIWPNEIGDKSNLFPSAQALIDKTDATADEMFASVADIRAFRNEVRNCGALASLVYTFGAEYGTLLSPVPATLPEGVKVYTCDEVNAQNELVLTPAVDSYGNESIEANKAYILQGTEGKTFQLIGWNQQPADNADQVTGILTGVYTAKEAPAESYVLLNKNDILGFYRVVAGNQPTVGANRCYITPETSSEAPAFFFSDGTQTGIESIGSDVKTEQVFDLSGRRVNTAKKGLYIVNGKKMMVK